MEKRRKEKIKEINSKVDLDGRSVGRGNSAGQVLGREGGEWTNNGGKEAQRPRTKQSMWGPLRTETLCGKLPQDLRWLWMTCTRNCNELAQVFSPQEVKIPSVKTLSFLETFWLESISAIFDIGTLEDDVPLGS